MIYLYTDFGSSDLYLGQVKAALLQHAPDTVIIDLCNDLPAYSVRRAAHLLAAMLTRLQDSHAVLLCVVDPGVGSERRPLAVQVDGSWLVGPDNGLLSVAMQRAGAVVCHEILWRPPVLSSTFHGRDLFAPCAALLQRQALPADSLRVIDDAICCDTGDDLAEILYLDHYGNALTGLRASKLPPQATLLIGGQRLPQAGTFSAVSVGTAFWYENSLGLVEIAVNQGRAADLPGMVLGATVAYVA